MLIFDKKKEKNANKNNNNNGFVYIVTTRELLYAKEFENKAVASGGHSNNIRDTLGWMQQSVT